MFCNMFTHKKHVIRHVFVQLNKKNQQISGARNYPQSVGLNIYKLRQLYIVLIHFKFVLIVGCGIL